MGLFDMVMIKDNHVTAAGGITAAVNRAQVSSPSPAKSCIYVKIEEMPRDARALWNVHKLVPEECVRVSYMTCS